MHAGSLQFCWWLTSTDGTCAFSFTHPLGNNNQFHEILLNPKILDLSRHDSHLLGIGFYVTTICIYCVGFTGLLRDDFAACFKASKVTMPIPTENTKNTRINNHSITDPPIRRFSYTLLCLPKLFLRKLQTLQTYICEPAILNSYFMCDDNRLLIELH